MGVECLSRFNGMFAFALWDKSTRRLFCARDRLGIKPFYYSFGSSEFVFASELKAVSQVCPALRQPCYGAVYDFLTLMRFDHDDRTFLADVRQLLGGHYLLLDLDRWELSAQKRYWTLSPARSAEALDYSRPVDTFRELLFDSVRLQLRSDVPVGTFLSGGLDSSSLVAIISKLVSQPMQSFSVAYNETCYNEQEFMDAVVSSYPVIPTRTFPSAEKLRSDLVRFVWAQDTPPAGPGPFSEWCVAESAQGKVTVLLNGQGPDEMLGGYPSCFPSYMYTLRNRIASKGDQRGWSAIFEDANTLSLLYKAGPLTSRAYYLLSAAIPDRQLQSFLSIARRRIRERWLHPDLSAKHSRWAQQTLCCEMEPPRLIVCYNRGWWQTRFLHCFTTRTEMRWLFLWRHARSVSGPPLGRIHGRAAVASEAIASLHQADSPSSTRWLLDRQSAHTAHEARICHADRRLDSPETRSITGSAN